MKKLFSLFVAGLMLACLAIVPAFAGGERMRVLTFQVYATGYATDSDHTGTTIPQGSGVASWTGASGASKFLTVTYEGKVANTEDNRTVDMRKWAPNGIEAAFLTLRHGLPHDNHTTGVTSTAIGTNYLLVGALVANTLSATDGVESGTSEWTNLNSHTSGVSRITLAHLTTAGATNYPVNVTSIMQAYPARYWRFFVAGVTTSGIPSSGTSQWPGSPAGTSWNNEVGPKLYLTIVPKGAYTDG